MKKIYFLIIPLLIVFILTGCSENKNLDTVNQELEVSVTDLLQVDDDGNTNVDFSALNGLLSTASVTELSPDEIDGIKYMYEEEKLAKDVYQALYEKYENIVFSNIAKSESTHQSAIASLAQSYQVDISDLSQIAGIFTNDELQELYIDLVSQGSESLDEALKVGAAIEEIDIIDLEKYIEATTNQDIILIYENLQRGSRNHLRAFVRNITRSGNSYQGQYLDNVNYQEIISGDIERGGTNNRSQQGQGKNR